MNTIKYSLAICALAGATACSGSDGDATARENAVPAASQLIQGTPAGGISDWARDIQNGLRDLEEHAAQDAQAAQREALDLYVGRQEYIELYWGPSGRLLPAGGESLGEAVLHAETGFHELLQLLAASPIDTSRIRERVDTVTVRLERVLAAARSANATMIPPGNRPATLE
jgi:hypothetical protein